MKHYFPNSTDLRTHELTENAIRIWCKFTYEQWSMALKEYNISSSHILMTCALQRVLLENDDLKFEYQRLYDKLALAYNYYELKEYSQHNGKYTQLVLKGL